MGENEVLNDLSDIRVKVLDFNEGDTGICELIELIDEKMDKYRGKEIIIK